MRGAGLDGDEVFCVKLSVEGGLFEFDVQTLKNVQGLLVPGSADDGELVWLDVVVMAKGVLAYGRVLRGREGFAGPYADSSVICSALREVATSLAYVACR